MKKVLKKLTILTLLVSLGVVISACLKNPQTNQNTNQLDNAIKETEPRQQEEDLEEIILETEEIDTSDWLTYRNEEYGFEFRLPFYWEVYNIDTNRLGLGDFSKQRIDDEAAKYGHRYSGDIILEVFRNDNFLSIKNFYDYLNFNPFKQINPLESKIGDHDVYLFINMPGIVLTDIYILKINDLILEFTAFNSKEIMDLIIKSIRQLD